MQQKNKETTLLKPIILIFLQIITLFTVFNLLSTKEFFSPIETIWLSSLLGFIMISSIFTFGILDKMREEENKKQKATF